MRTITKSHHVKRDRLLSIATKIFTEVSFDRTSMSQIALACGVSKATIYHYFDSKNAILYAILERHLAALRDYVLAIDKGERSAEEFFAHVVEEILVFYRNNDDVHVLQTHALGQLEQKEQKVLVGYMRTLVSHIDKLIKDVNPESFDSPDKLRMATMSLFGMLNWYYTWNHGDGIKERREYARYAAQIMLRGAY